MSLTAGRVIRDEGEQGLAEGEQETEVGVRRKTGMWNGGWSPPPTLPVLPRASLQAVRVTFQDLCADVAAGVGRDVVVQPTAPARVGPVRPARSADRPGHQPARVGVAEGALHALLVTGGVGGDGGGSATQQLVHADSQGPSSGRPAGGRRWGEPHDWPSSLSATSRAGAATYGAAAVDGRARDGAVSVGISRVVRRSARTTSADAGDTTRLPGQGGEVVCRGVDSTNVLSVDAAGLRGPTSRPGLG